MDGEKFDFDKENSQTPEKQKFPLVWAGLLLVLLIILAGGYLLFKHSAVSPATTGNTAANVTSSPSPSPSATGLSQGNSDSALNQDTAQIDSQLNQLNQDLNSVNSSFSHQSQEAANASNNSY